MVDITGAWLALKGSMSGEHIGVVRGAGGVGGANVCTVRETGVKGEEVVAA